MRHLIVAAAAACAIAVCGAAPANGGITISHVIGPELPGAYKHPASFTELSNGDLYLAYYGGGGEYTDDSVVWGMRKPAGEDDWGTPRIIADTPFLSEGNPVVWEAPDSVVWLFYVQRYGDTWSDSRIKAKISRDHAETWSDNFVLAFEKGMMVRSRPIVLDTGEYLLPIYHETGHDRDKVGADTTSRFLRYDPETHRWSESGVIHSRSGNLQPSVVQIDSEYLISYSRRGGGYEPVDDGWIVRSESRDGGQTWAPGEDSPFPNPNSAIDFIRLESGNLLLAYNDSMVRRSPLTIALSTDNDESYPYRRNIAEGDNTFAYPVALQARDGAIHLIYTTNSRTTIMHVVFEESAILDPEYRIDGQAPGN